MGLLNEVIDPRSAAALQRTFVLCHEFTFAYHLFTPSISLAYLFDPHRDYSHSAPRNEPEVAPVGLAGLRTARWTNRRDSTIRGGRTA